jgi:hypothetical protein
MPRIDNTRKARYRAALIRSGLTQEQWAEQNKMVREHLNRVLNGHILSPRVEGMIDAFIVEVEAKVSAA